MAFQKKIKVSYVMTHPVQYLVPLIRKLARSDDIELFVVYGTDASAGVHSDGGFSGEVSWGLPLLDGYQHAVLYPGKEMGRGFFWMGAKGIKRNINRASADVLITHGWGSYLYLAATWAAFQKKIPVIYRTDAGPPYDRRDYDPGLKAYRLRKAMKPYVLNPLLRRIHGILASGTMNRNFYLEVGVDPERIFWAPQCIDASLFSPKQITEQMQREKELELGLRSDSFRILFSGKLVERKRPLDLVKAVSQMPSRDSMEVLFIGDGEQKTLLQELSRELRVRARFTGFRSPAELPLLYSLCHVLALPSRNEPWGLVVNEAMSMGIPAVVSDAVGCSRDLVIENETGFVFPTGDVPALAAALENITSSPDLYSRLRENARQTVADFSMDRTVQGYLEAIDYVTKRV